MSAQIRQDFDGVFATHLRSALEDRIKLEGSKIVEECMAMAVSQLRKRATEMVAQVCIDVFSLVEMHKLGNTLEIRVRIPEAKRDE